MTLEEIINEIEDQKKAIAEAIRKRDAYQSRLDALITQPELLVRSWCRSTGHFERVMLTRDEEGVMFEILEGQERVPNADTIKEPVNEPTPTREVNEVTAMAHMAEAIDLISDASNRPDPPAMIYTEREHPDDDRAGTGPS